MTGLLNAKLRICSDVHEPLIMMWKALQIGYTPLYVIS